MNTAREFIPVVQATVEDDPIITWEKLSLDGWLDELEVKALDLITTIRQAERWIAITHMDKDTNSVADLLRALKGIAED